MNIDANDPRWTAYALGELKDEKERAELESILKESEAMRLMVDEIRRTAEWLNDGMKQESFVGLTQTQRERIETQATKQRSWFWSRPVWALSAAAACMVLILSVWMYQSQNNSTDSVTLMADLRNDAAPESAPVRTAADKTKTEVEIAPYSLTVTGAEEGKAEETDFARAADDSRVVETPSGEKNSFMVNAEHDAADSATMDSKTVAPAIPAQIAEARPVLPAPGSDEMRKQAASERSLQSMDAQELNKIMGSITPAEGAASQSFAGVAADQINIQQDGITINDARYKNGVASSNRMNSEMVVKKTLAPADAEKGRAAGQVQVTTASGDEEGRYRRGRIFPPRPTDNFNTEGYDRVVDNPFMEVTQNPLSTFSIDVDTASYSNVRRFLDDGSLPPKDAVRIEELINYFDYDYKGPGREGPFAAHFEMTEAPWNAEHRLLRIGLKAKEIKGPERPVTNLVFLVDVSGSMSDANKLPLVQDALRLLTDQLTESDHVAIVTYAGSTRVALPSTSGDQKWKIYREIDRLRSGGSTAGASGIQLAYDIARRNFKEGGANRVILATDGDFNVGITNHGDLARLIEEKADSGVFLSALGFGMGNYKDDTLELLANKGRGNYAYIDTISEARKVLVEQINATLIGVAKDVKIQVEFNPGQVGAYRLIGYEDKIMPKEDFNNDTKKASVIGAGHAVTAIYEIVPAGAPIPSPGVDPLKYQKPAETKRSVSSDEVATVKIRYKDPEGEESRLMEFAVRDSDKSFNKASRDFKFAASVAAFGMVLRDSPYKGDATLDHALVWANEGKGADPHGYRGEYIRLLHRAMSIKK